eukprot:1401085-Rhodomonas_salina.1
MQDGSLAMEPANDGPTEEDWAELDEKQEEGDEEDPLQAVLKQMQAKVVPVWLAVQSRFSGADERFFFQVEHIIATVPILSALSHEERDKLGSNVRTLNLRI